MQVTHDPTRSGIARRIARGCLVGLFTITLAACGSGSDDEKTTTAATAEKLEKQTAVNFTYSPIAGVAPLFVGDDEGFFRDENLDVERVVFPSPAPAIADMLAGRQQFVISGVGQIATGVARGLPLKIVAPAFFSKGESTGLWVEADSGIRTVADLAGKKIGVAATNNNLHAALLKILEDEGVDPDSVSFNVIAMPNLLQAIKRGTVDAAMFAEPFTTVAGKAIRNLIPDVVHAYNSERPPLQSYVLTSQKYAQEHPDVVAAMTRAWLKAAEFSQEHPDAVRKAVGTYTEVKPDVLSKMTLPAFGSDLQQASFAAVAELMKRYEFIDELPTPEAIEKLFPDPATYPAKQD